MRVNKPMAMNKWNIGVMMSTVNNVERMREFLNDRYTIDHSSLYRLAVTDMMDFLKTLPPDDPWQPIETPPGEGGREMKSFPTCPNYPLNRLFRW